MAPPKPKPAEEDCKDEGSDQESDCEGKKMEVWFGLFIYFPILYTI